MGFLTVINHTNKFSKNGNGIYNCLCICGNTTELPSSCLTEKASWKPSCGCQIKKYRDRSRQGEVALNCYFIKYQEGAKRRNIEWKLHKCDFETIVHQNCFYCGSKPRLFNPYINHKRDGKNIKLIEKNWIEVNGIDRVNSNDNYNIHNCVACCTICNLAKRDMSRKNFLDWIKQISEFQFGSKN